MMAALLGIFASAGNSGCFSGVYVVCREDTWVASRGLRSGSPFLLLVLWLIDKADRLLREKETKCAESGSL